MDDVTLTQTVCALLADANGWAWRPSGPAYTQAEIGLFYGALGSTPDRAVGVTLYGDADDLETGLAVRRVQIRHRGPVGASQGADELAAATFSALQGLARTAGISLVNRVLVARLGADANARQERADSYQIIVDNPEVAL